MCIQSKALYACLFLYACFLCSIFGRHVGCEENKRGKNKHSNTKMAMSSVDAALINVACSYALYIRI